jgi:hypothetical protein
MALIFRANWLYRDATIKLRGTQTALFAIIFLLVPVSLLGGTENITKRSCRNNLNS